MGRIPLILTFVISVSFVATGTARAWDWPGGDKSEKSAEPAQGAAPAKAQGKAADRDRAARDKAMKDWQAKLSNSRWELEVTVSSGGPARVVQSDILKFERGTMKSETLEKAGFERAPYALYPPTDKSVEWEAMQRKTADGAEESAIWRGEITGDVMQGTMIKKVTEGDKENTQVFSFSGRLTTPEPEPVPEPVVQTPPPAAPETAPAAETEPAAQVPAPSAPETSKAPVAPETARKGRR